MTLNYILKSVEYSLIAITPRFTLTQSGSNFLAPIYETNRSVQIYLEIICIKNSYWSFNCLQKIIIINYLKLYNCLKYLKPYNCVQIVCIR